MRALIFLTLVASMACASAEPKGKMNCLASAVYTVPESKHQTFISCDGYGGNTNITWLLPSENPRLLDFTSLETTSVSDRVTIFYNGQTYGPFSGTKDPGSFPFGRGLIRVEFICNRDVFKKDGFSLLIAPDIKPLVSGQPYSFPLPTITAGLFHFGIPNGATGRLLLVEADFIGYRGSAPVLLLSKDHVPFEVQFDWRNVTREASGRFSGSLIIPNPPVGALPLASPYYYLAIVVRGNATQVTVKYTKN